MALFSDRSRSEVKHYLRLTAAHCSAASMAFSKGFNLSLLLGLQTIGSVPQRSGRSDQYRHPAQ